MPADSNASMLHDHGRFAPDRVANLSFGTSFRGFDQGEVRAFLVDLAKEIRAARDREAELQAKVDDLEEQVQRVRRDAQDEARAPKVTELDEHEIAAKLGEETVRIVEAAREAAAGIRSKAEESVADMLREARDEATTVRAEAEDVLRVRTEEAEREAAKIVEAAEVIRHQAVADGEEEVEKARLQGREMVAEARAVRERMLHDLAQRRKFARQQLEQLRAGRERLLQSYDVVRQTLDAVTNELEVALPEAQAAAVQAGQRVAAEELEPTIQELEAELAQLAPLVRDGADDVAGSGGAPAAADDPASEEGAEAVGGTGDPSGAPTDTTEVGDAADAVEATASDRTASDGAATPDDTASTSPSGGKVGNGRRAKKRFTDADAAQLPKGERAPVEPSAPFEEVRVIAPDGDEAAGAEGSAGDESATGDAGAAGDGPAESAKSVDDLFARLRAEQAAEPEADAEAEADANEATEAVGAGEAEPVGGDEGEVASVDAAGGAPVAADGGDVTKASEEATETTESETTESGATELGATESGVAASGAAESGAAETTESGAGAGSSTADAPAAGDSTDTESGDTESGDTEAADRREILERRNAAVAVVDRTLSRRLKRVLADEQNEVLDRLRRGAVASIDDMLPSVADQTARYAATATDSLEQARSAGAEFFAGTDAARAAGVAIDDLANELAELMVSLLRERIERAVGEVSGDADDLADRVRASYREWKSQRIAETAQHYVVAAFTRGLFEAQPDGTKLGWLIDDGGAPCPDCDDNALAGAVEKGVAFPTGSLYPPAHPGCRCLLVPDGK